MKTLPWFRMYSDFIHDELIEMLAFEDQRHFVFLLCMKNAGSLDKDYPDAEMLDIVVSRRLGIHGEALANAKIRLMKVGLIDSNWQPTGWDKRQFVSDSNPTNAERQKRYREAHKNTSKESNVTRNVTVTLTDTDTDTDTDKYKKTRAIAPPDGVDKSVWADFVELRKSKKAKLTQTALDGITSEADKAGWTLENALRECCSRGWTGFKAYWVADKTSAKSSKPPESFRERDDRLGRERWEEMTGRIHPATPWSF